MDLLKATPISTAKFKFTVNGGEPVCTDKGAEMFVEILGSHAKEFQAALLKKYQRAAAILESYKDKADPDKEVPKKCQKELADSDVEFLCEITQGVLFQVDGKECTDINAFYSNPDLEYWVFEVDKFAGNTANFILA